MCINECGSVSVHCGCWSNRYSRSPRRDDREREGGEDRRNTSVRDSRRHSRSPSPRNGDDRSSSTRDSHSRTDNQDMERETVRSRSPSPRHSQSPSPSPERGQGQGQGQGQQDRDRDAHVGRDRESDRPSSSSSSSSRSSSSVGNANKKENMDDEFFERRLHVSNLSERMDDEGFKREFEKFGEITDVVVIRNNVTKVSKRYGFVEFATVEQARRAFSEMQDTVVDGSRIIIKSAKPKRPDDDKFPQNTKLYVGNICDGVTADDFRKEFERFGEVAEINFPGMVSQKSGMAMGFVTMKYGSDAVAARRGLHGQHKLRGNQGQENASGRQRFPPLIVDFARPKPGFSRDTRRSRSPPRRERARSRSPRRSRSRSVDRRDRYRDDRTRRTSRSRSRDRYASSSYSSSSSSYSDRRNDRRRSRSRSRSRDRRRVR